MRIIRRSWTLVLTVDTVAAIIPSMTIQLFHTHPSWHNFLVELPYAFIYAHSIGTLCFIILHRVAPPLYRLPKVYTLAGLVVALVTIAVIGSIIANGLFVLLGMYGAGEFWPALRFGLKTSIIVTVLVGTTITLFEGLSYSLQEARLALRTKELDEERARKLASEARLSSLESRIHPHFLFNTLNSISALVREDPARAERTVERLAALLRYSLDTGRRPLVPVRQEMRVVHDYLEIEKTRFADRLRYAFEVPEELEELEVPPMAIQTLVENSIKYAVSPSREGGEIRVSARLEEGALVLAVSDDGPGFDLRALQEGHGLENLQDRLSTLFDGAGRLELARRDGRMVVSVVVPQKKVLV